MSFRYKRLGHGPLVTLKNLSCFKGVSNNSMLDQYKIRPFAKQSRKVFSLSGTTIDASFYLLHTDVWGPYRVPSQDGKI